MVEAILIYPGYNGVILSVCLHSLTCDFTCICKRIVNAEQHEVLCKRNTFGSYRNRNPVESGYGYGYVIM